MSDLHVGEDTESVPMVPCMFVQPGVPVATVVDEASVGGVCFVQLNVETVHGTAVYFLSAEHARDLATKLKRASYVATTGLIVP